MQAVRRCDRKARRHSVLGAADLALGHPLPGTQTIAAQILGERRERAEQPLRALVRGSDPCLAAQALQSLVSIVGVTAAKDLLEQ